VKIVTVTLNPVFDLFYTIPHFQPYRENLASKVEVFPGGKAVNVSRALKANGYESTAVLVLGEENGQAFEASMEAEGLNTRIYRVKGRIRENLTTLTEGVPETRICIHTFSLTKEILDSIADDLLSLVNSDTAVVISGKFPKGLTMNDCTDFVRHLQKVTPYIALDSQTFGAEEILTLKPWLIKPNEEEIASLVGHPCTDLPSLTEAANAIHRGGVGNVLISLGGDGALYVGELGSFCIEVPAIAPLSTIGAGDSTLAGFLSAYTEGLDAVTCLTRACAFGTAACLEEGTAPPRPQIIAEIQRSISVHVLP